MTPPVTSAGLYKGLLELKDSLVRWREMTKGDPKQAELELLIKEQAESLNFSENNIEALWLKILETEEALVPEGLHILGEELSDRQCSSYISSIDGIKEEERKSLLNSLKKQNEIPAIINALDGKFTPPVPGGDIVRSKDILPTGRNIHAFDPFRMPTTFACRQGEIQADLLLKTHKELPKTVALVLWGSDNIKSDGEQIAQALSLIHI